MKCVVYSKGELPGFKGIRGPIMSPLDIDVHLVLKWVYFGVDVREVMDDGSHRKLKSNDERLMNLIDADLEERRQNKLRKMEDKYKKPEKHKNKEKEFGPKVDTKEERNAKINKLDEKMKEIEKRKEAREEEKRAEREAALAAVREQKQKGRPETAPELPVDNLENPE